MVVCLSVYFVVPEAFCALCLESIRQKVCDKDHRPPRNCKSLLSRLLYNFLVICVYSFNERIIAFIILSLLFENYKR